jgi:hypothetical protein
VPDVPGIFSAEELERLPHAELTERLAEAYQLIGQLRVRVEELERRAGKDSSTSSKPRWCCGTVSEGVLPSGVRARASFGPETNAQAADLACAHYLPVPWTAGLLCRLAGIAVSTGWVAGSRGKAAALIEASGFQEQCLKPVDLPGMGCTFPVTE